MCPRNFSPFSHFTKQLFFSSRENGKFNRISLFGTVHKLVFLLHNASDTYAERRKRWKSLLQRIHFEVFGNFSSNFLFSLLKQLSLQFSATCDSKNDRTMNFSGLESKFNFVPSNSRNYFYPRARTLQIKNNDYTELSFHLCLSFGGKAALSFIIERISTREKFFHRLSARH